jgi:hypothetical protein
MIDWNDASSAMENTVAEVFDREAFELVPMARGLGVNNTRVADTERAGFAFTGSVDFGPAPLTPGFSHAATLMSDRERAREMPAYEAVISALSTEWPVRAKVDDQIVWIRKARDGTERGRERFVIAAIPVDGGNRLAIFVNRTKGKP